MVVGVRQCGARRNRFAAFRAQAEKHRLVWRNIPSVDNRHKRPLRVMSPKEAPYLFGVLRRAAFPLLVKLDQVHLQVTHHAVVQALASLAHAKRQAPDGVSFYAKETCDGSDRESFRQRTDDLSLLVEWEHVHGLAWSDSRGVYGASPEVTALNEVFSLTSQLCTQTLYSIKAPLVLSGKRVYISFYEKGTAQTADKGRPT